MRATIDSVPAAGLSGSLHAIPVRVFRHERSKIGAVRVRKRHTKPVPSRSVEARSGQMLSPRLTSTGLLFILLAGVMCLCGAVGYQHLAAPGPVASLEAHRATAQAEPYEAPAEDHGPQTIASTATLLLVSAGAALYLILVYSRGFSAPGSRLSSRRPPPRTAPVSTRSPVRTQLQVFLL